MFDCTFNYVNSPHLSQIYVGFELLKKQGFVNYKVNYEKKNSLAKPLLKVRLNGKHSLIFDTLDGLNWIDGTVQENLNFFHDNFKCDFYFKRSYCKSLRDHAPENCKVFPLGFNYHLHDNISPLNMRTILYDTVQNSTLLCRLLKINKDNFKADQFEFYPKLSDKIKILFLARLWDPNEVQSEFLKEEREKINRNRTDCIIACKKEFGDQFTGGIIKDSFSVKYSKDLLAPYSLTGKSNYLNEIKKNHICIATAGLHNSIGWKFGEYVAAARAIVTEPMFYEVPGDFEISKNYLVFNNEEELINNLSFLMHNRDHLFQMMNNNFLYYNNYLKPERLVMNALLKVESEISPGVNSKSISFQTLLT